MSPSIQIETLWSKPLHSGNRTIITQSRALSIQLPFLRGGMVWNRPVSVLVLSDDGTDLVLPVRDVTRLVQVLLFINAMVSVGISLFIMSRRAH